MRHWNLVGWLALVTALLVILGVLFIPPVQYVYEKYESIRRQIEFEEKIDAALEGLEETGLKMLYHERMYPTSYGDKDGNVYTFWSYTCENWENKPEDEPPALYQEIFDPETAETSREVQVGENPGTIYEKDGRAYLIWSPVNQMREVILMIDYDPNVFTEEDMMKVAESCAKV